MPNKSHIMKILIFIIQVEIPVFVHLGILLLTIKQTLSILHNVLRLRVFSNTAALDWSLPAERPVVVCPGKALLGYRLCR